MSRRMYLSKGYDQLVAALLAGAMLVCLGLSAAASTVLPGGDPDRIIDITGSDFVISIAADAEGRFEQRYRNSTSGPIEELTFRFWPALPASPKAASGMFGAVFADRDMVVFNLGQHGSGIALGAVFRIRMGGLVPFATSAFGDVDPGPLGPPPPVDPGELPAAVPLPPAAVLLALALAVLPGLRQRQRTA